MDCRNCGRAMEKDRYEDQLDFESEYEQRGLIDSASTHHDRVVYECQNCGRTQASKLFAMTFNPGRLGEITGSVSREDVVPFCREEGVVGIGWGYELTEDPETKERALELLIDGDEFNESGQTSRRWKDFIIWLSEDDLVYVYDKPSGEYWQVRVDSDWKYVTTSGLPEIKQKEYIDHDIWHYRDAVWKPISLKEIHGSIQSSTSPQGTIQKIHASEPSITYSVNRFFGSELSSEVDVETLQHDISSLSDTDLIDALHNTELEDVVIQYVQREKDAVFVNRTGHKDKPDVECLLRRVHQGEPYHIGIQVKSGGLSADNKERLQSFLEKHEQLYTFTRDGTGVSGGHSITDAELGNYIREYLPEMPPSVLWRYSALLDSGNTR